MNEILNPKSEILNKFKKTKNNAQNFKFMGFDNLKFDNLDLFRV